MAFKFKYTCEFCGIEKVMTEEQAKTAICECEKTNKHLNKLINSYDSGNYIAIFRCISTNTNWTISPAPDWEDEKLDWKLIHKEDESILKAFLENNNITIQSSYNIDSLNMHKIEKIVDNFINEYNEFYKYKLLPNIDELKQKYNTGKYILVRNKLSNKEKFFIDDKLYYQIGIKVILIHQKHKQILDAYIENNEVEIELNSKDDIWFLTDFINKYDEDFDYRLKPKQEFPIFKENEDGEILKFTSENFYEIVLSYAYTYIGKKYRNENKELLELLKDVPYDKKRNLYHKQPIWCWDNHCKCSRQLRLYDAINNSTFDTFGNENGASYNNYEPLTTDQIKSMSFIWNIYKKI